MDSYANWKCRRSGFFKFSPWDQAIQRACTGTLPRTWRREWSCHLGGLSHHGNYLFSLVLSFGMFSFVLHSLLLLLLVLVLLLLLLFIIYSSPLTTLFTTLIIFVLSFFLFFVFSFSTPSLSLSISLFLCPSTTIFIRTLQIMISWSTFIPITATSSSPVDFQGMGSWWLRSSVGSWPSSPWAPHQS